MNAKTPRTLKYARRSSSVTFHFISKRLSCHDGCRYPWLDAPHANPVRYTKQNPQPSYQKTPHVQWLSFHYHRPNYF